MQSIAVIGEGSWATALVKILSNNITTINWHIRTPSIYNYIKENHRNPEYLSSVELDLSVVNLFTNINKAVSDTNIVLLVVPSAFLKSTLNELTCDLSNKIIVSAIKGIVPDENILVADYLSKKYNVPINSIVIISGPSHSEEVALERLTYLTIASTSNINAKLISDAVTCRFIKPSLSDDIYGTEYAAVLKNIYALAAGICHGLGYGDNFMAVLISNAIQEMKRFIDKVHPITRDINDSVYLGDLIVTAYSQFSRNRTFGAMIGKGYSVKSAQLEMNMIAEGYYATKSIYEINKLYNVYLPIANAVYNILYEKVAPSIEIKLLSDKLK